jgi:3-oxoacyl-[acyl-carrier protein] reductase
LDEEKKMALKGKVALVTGAANGLGKQFAVDLAVKGVKVAAVDIDRDGLEQVVQDIRDAGGVAEPFVANLMHASEIEEAVRQITGVYGVVDIVANVAGIYHDGQRLFFEKVIHETSIEEIDALLDVNLRATMLVSRACLPGMVERQRGKIINISGCFPEGGYGCVHYYVSKKAVEAFTQSVALEYRKHNIQVYCISPGDINSEVSLKLNPEKYHHLMMDMADVTRLAVFLLEDPAADQIPGHVIAIGDHQTGWDMGQWE